METLKKKQFNGAQKVISNGAKFSGWLFKEEKKIGFNNKKSIQKFCIIYNGEFLIYNGENSEDPIGSFPLSAYRAKVFAEEGKTQKFFLKFESISQLSYLFSCSSYKEIGRWLNFVNDETAAYYPNGEKIQNDDYDYAQLKPTDVSFSNPEQFDTHENESEKISISSNAEVEGFRGPICKLPKSPDIVKSDQNQPTPPPRPEKTTKLCTKIESAYEFIEPNLMKKKCIEEKQSCEFLFKSGNNTERREVNEAVPSISHRDCGALKKSKEPSESKYKDVNILPTSVYQWNLKREKAEDLLKRKKTVGVYLIRKNSEGRHILSILCEEVQQCRHYIIFQKHGQQFLATEPGPKFSKIADLIRYYMKNFLPTCNVKLTQPFC